MEKADFWQTVGLAAAIATGISTVLTLAFSLVWRLLDRRRAHWLPFDGKSGWSAPEGKANHGIEPHAVFELANTGDGDAFAVQVVGLGCRPEMRSDAVRTDWGRHRDKVAMLPVLRSGGTVNLKVWCEPAHWDVAEVAVVWTASPTWLRLLSRRVRYLPVRQIAARPRMTKVETDDDLKITTVELPDPDRPVLPPGLRSERGPRPAWWRRWARSRVKRDLKRA